MYTHSEPSELLCHTGHCCGSLVPSGEGSFLALKTCTAMPSGFLIARPQRGNFEGRFSTDPLGPVSEVWSVQ